MSSCAHPRARKDANGWMHCPDCKETWETPGVYKDDRR